MQPKNRRVAVFFASAIAVIAIAAAAVSHFSNGKPPDNGSGGVIAVSPDTKKTAIASTTAAVTPSNWQQTLEAANLTGKVNTASPTDALTNGLNAQYQTLTDSATSPAQKQAILKNIVANAVPDIGTAKQFTLADIKVSTSTDIEGYALILTLVLRQSSDVREYEMATFSRAVQNNNTTGSPELTEDATIYNRIRDELIAMAVPKSVAQEHLAVVNSIGALAQVVSTMASWNGDPTLGIVYVSAFESAQDVMNHSIVGLVSKIEQLEQS